MTRTIMTVDDSPSMRALLRHALSGEGYQIAAAEDGVDALERIDAAAPDLVITDINMPRMDGFGLIEQLRGHPRWNGVPILVLTTEFSDEKKARARAAGATGWIVKPFDPAKLSAAVRRVLI
ncbi:response regulator [Sphingomonas carotinifaciens]|jgi:two-component system chemotaxis response regulator CheY|uniref:Response regulator n=1 Tax=Sphingomonas carotinifaciens TaxID=1166323 RepID=A0A1G7G3M8_9SPHN|nr:MULTISPECIES: response regulator [Sphingomonas]MBB4086365.1 two-component system chemotaxis response regulator CheY [Sphingomonas carotinifaciens]MWC42685.1 response regulator [Sphingomonas carotinifaciens]SDE82707.1 two-component system, chemotaxis family, response regulator CheY [Sphingomonas carotinifaciens]